MTNDRQDAATLNLIRERADTKRRGSVLKRELRAAGKSLYDIGGALKHASPDRIGSRIDYLLPMLRDVQQVCELAAVCARLEELKELELRLAQLNRLASELGID